MGRRRRPGQPCIEANWNPGQSAFLGQKRAPRGGAALPHVPNGCIRPMSSRGRYNPYAPELDRCVQLIALLRRPQRPRLTCRPVREMARNCSACRALPRDKPATARCSGEGPSRNRQSQDVVQFRVCPRLSPHVDRGSRTGHDRKTMSRRWLSRIRIADAARS